MMTAVVLSHGEPDPALPKPCLVCGYRPSGVMEVKPPDGPAVRFACCVGCRAATPLDRLVNLNVRRVRRAQEQQRAAMYLKTNRQLEPREPWLRAGHPSSCRMSSSLHGANVGYCQRCRHYLQNTGRLTDG